MIQKYIHNMQPPYRPPMKVWVGYDDEGLGAVAAVEELHSAADISITLMAVARRHRGEGGGYADDMMEFVLADLEGVGVELGFDTVAISTHIHRLNSASQDFARRFHFRHTDWFDEDHQIWATRRVLPQGEADFAERV